MVSRIIDEIHPDYLTIENEPGTQRFNTGLDISVENQTKIVREILDGLDRKGVRIGAGAGTLEKPSYFKSLAENTTIDYIDMHVYPVAGKILTERIKEISMIARQNNKGLAIGEAWLYKATDREL